MAREGTIAISLRVTKNAAQVANTSSTTIDVSGSQLLHNTQNIGTTSETIDFGNISGTPQAVMIRNLDATNFVEIGGDTGLTVFKIKIPKGQSTIIYPSSGTIYAKADTAAVNILVTACEA